jgi:hypothetical protein
MTNRAAHEIASVNHSRSQDCSLQAHVELTGILHCLAFQCLLGGQAIGSNPESESIDRSCNQLTNTRQDSSVQPRALLKHHVTGQPQASTLTLATYSEP